MLNNLLLQRVPQRSREALVLLFRSCDNPRRSAVIAMRGKAGKSMSTRVVILRSKMTTLMVMAEVMKTRRAMSTVEVTIGLWLISSVFLEYLFCPYVSCY